MSNKRILTLEEITSIWTNANFLEGGESQSWQEQSKGQNLGPEFMKLMEKNCFSPVDASKILEASAHLNDPNLVEFHEARVDLVAWIACNRYLMTSPKFRSYYLMLHPVYGLYFAKYCQRCKAALVNWTDPSEKMKKPLVWRNETKRKNSKYTGPITKTQMLELMTNTLIDPEGNRRSSYADIDLTKLHPLLRARVKPLFRALKNLGLCSTYEDPSNLLAQAFILLYHSKLEPLGISRRGFSVYFSVGPDEFEISHWNLSKGVTEISRIQSFGLGWKVMIDHWLNGLYWHVGQKAI